MNGFAGRSLWSPAPGRASVRPWHRIWPGGLKVAISDVSLEGLAATEERLKTSGAPSGADPLDVSDRDRVVAYADEVRAHFGGQPDLATTRASRSSADRAQRLR